jgi:hypothetical protein
LLTTRFPQFQKNSLKSKIIPLSEEELNFLEEDGIVLSESGRFPSQILPSLVVHSSVVTQGDEDPNSDWEHDESEREVTVARFPELEEKIQAAIDEFDGEVFCKLNWSSAKVRTCTTTYRHAQACTGMHRHAQACTGMHRHAQAHAQARTSR